MTCSRFFRSGCAFAALLFLLSLQSALCDKSPQVVVTPQKTSGIYAIGEKVVWNVKVLNDPSGSVTNATYKVLRGGATSLADSSVSIVNGEATIESSLDTPGTLLLMVWVDLGDKNILRALGGAVIAPDKIAVSSPAPEDFDSFWKAKIAELNAVPANPSLEKGDSGSPNVDYWKVTLDNVRGTHVYGQLARPTSGEKFPALLIVQWAGIYPLQKSWVVGMAAKGWLVLNISAHDLPIDQPVDFYNQKSSGELRDYTAIGNEDRETSYFLRMFLGDYRAADYLASRPDWDDKTLVVTGTSQGGLQSFVTAGLYPKVSAMVVNLPAGCDQTGSLVGRKPGWPNWEEHTRDRDAEKVMHTAPYFDAVNFAARVKCPAFVALGLIDQTARPEGILAATNQLKGPKEVMIVPLGEHKENPAIFKPVYARMDEWKNALLRGESVPPAAK